MANTRPPKKLKPGQQISAREYNRGVDQLARASRVRGSGILRATQGASGTNFSLDTSGFPFLARLVGVYTLTAADVASGGAFEGMAAKTQVYSFIEQVPDPASGFPIDAIPPRQTINASGSVADQTAPITIIPTAAFAMERNNAFLPCPGDTPVGFKQAGPYVEMRLRTSWKGKPVYEFGPTAENWAWLQVPAPQPQAITVKVDGVLNTLQAYPAKKVDWTIGNPSITWYFNSLSQSNAWLLSPNSPDPGASTTNPPRNLFPTSAGNYAIRCDLVATDQNGIPVYVWPFTPGIFFEMANSYSPQGEGSSQGILFGGLTVGDNAFILGYVNQNGQVTGGDVWTCPGGSASGAGVALQPYLGDTGTDGSGNQVVNGIIVSIGGGGSTSGGSDW